MRDINSVVLSGRLTRDAELRYTKAGQPICNFSIAVNRSVKRGEEWVDEASFIECSLWGKQGETLHKYLIKGTAIMVQGELRQDRWEQDGQTRSKVIVTVTSLRLVDRPRSAENQAANASDAHSASNATANGGRVDSGPSADEFDDSIPF